MKRTSGLAGDPSYPAVLGGPAVFPEGPPDWPGRRPEVESAVGLALRDGSWGRYVGRHSQQLVQRLAELTGRSHVVLCSSGTAAVELALRGLKLVPGDEVILGAYDFPGNFRNVLAVGARPRLVDVSPHNATLDPEALEESLTERTRAIVVSHLHGGVAALSRVRAFADRHGLAVVEDACQMPGAVVEGRPAGSWGDVGVFSFGGSKLLTAGRGGALFTDRAEVAQRIRLYTERGNTAYPLSELQAAALLPQLEELEQANRRRERGVRRLLAALSDMGLVPFQNEPTTPASRPGYYKVGFWYQPDAFEGLPREAFVAAVRAEGVALDVGFRALHRTHSRRNFEAAGPLTTADQADQRVVVLHHPVLLQGESVLDRVGLAVRKVQQHAREIRRAWERDGGLSSQPLA